LEVVFALGAGAELAVSPQPAMTAVAAANVVQRVMATSEGTVSEFPRGAPIYTCTDAKLVC
jgi:hypothetical protein